MLIHNPEGVVGQALIIDYTLAKSFTLSDEEVKTLAEQDERGSRGNHDLVIVAISTDMKLIDALIQYDGYKGGHPWKSTLAKNLDDARKWIEENRVK